MFSPKCASKCYKNGVCQNYVCFQSMKQAHSLSFQGYSSGLRKNRGTKSKMGHIHRNIIKIRLRGGYFCLSFHWPFNVFGSSQPARIRAINCKHPPMSRGGRECLENFIIGIALSSPSISVLLSAKGSTFSTQVDTVLYIHTACTVQYM